jgi:DNA end-binding protein Ku
MMPRALWNGSLSFGLVNVPVSLLSATRSRDVRMRELDSQRGVPVSMRRICTAENCEVPVGEVAHGIEVDEQMVMLTDEELATAQPRRTDTIEIAKFVELSQIDPVMYDRSYWLAPASESQGPLRAYRLLVETMSVGGRAAIGETVIHNREHPVVVRAHQDRLLLSTLLFGHEVRDVAELEIPATQLDKRAVQATIAVIEELSTDFEPSHYHDRHRERLKALIESKMHGKEIAPAPEPPAPEPTPDLIGALERSLAEIRAKHPQQAKTARGVRKTPSSKLAREAAERHLT